MSFIRTKIISGKEYAYLVENKWYKRGFKGKGKGPRQRVSKYLGRVYCFNKEKDIDFYNFKKINIMKNEDFQDTENQRFLCDLEQYLKENKNNKTGIFRDLVEWELFRHSIDKEEFLSAIKQAENAWEKPTGFDLFEYNQGRFNWLSW